MKVLILINTSTEQNSYEALACAFMLATFDHHVQLCLQDSCVYLLHQHAVIKQTLTQHQDVAIHSNTTQTNPSYRFAAMLKSLHMYDLPQAWLSLTSQLPSTNKLATQLCDEWQALLTLHTLTTDDLQHFDTVLNFS